MVNLIPDLELSALREDVNKIIGYDYDGDETGARVTCTIKRQTDTGPINETTLEYDNPVLSTLYSGPCFLSPIIYRRERQETVGAEAVRIRTYRVIVPWDAGDIWRHDIFEVTDAADPQLTGRPMSVVDVIYSTDQAARRLTVLDTSDT